MCGGGGEGDLGKPKIEISRSEKKESKNGYQEDGRILI
jgi:hypothetical protein